MSQSHRKALVQLIGHPTLPRTSLRSAVEMVDRGMLRWLTFPFTAEMVSSEQRERDMHRRNGNREYFRDSWSKSYVRATRNQPEWMPPQLGYGVMGMPRSAENGPAE